MRRLSVLISPLLCGLLVVLAACTLAAPGTGRVAAPTIATPGIAPTESAATPTVASTVTLTETTVPTTSVADNPLADTYWQLVSFASPGEDGTPTGETIPTLQFGADGTVSGAGGCNNFSGTYQVEDNTLTFGQFTSTLIACAEDVMAQEEHYLTALAAVTQFEEVREQLRLSSDGEDEVLNFIQTAPPSTTPAAGIPTGTVTTTATIMATPAITVVATTTATSGGVAGSCTWRAIHDSQPPDPAELSVSGVCIMPSAGYSLTLTRAEPQGINPAILLLNLDVISPTGIVAQVLTPFEVEYTEETDQPFDQVTILSASGMPAGATVDVEEATAAITKFGVRSPTNGGSLCPEDLFCLFMHKNFAGPKASLKTGWHDLGLTGLKNQASSAINRTNCRVTFIVLEDNLAGPVPPDSEVADLGSLGLDDFIEEVIVCEVGASLTWLKFTEIALPASRSLMTSNN